jgi:hypothetical protein
MKNQMTFIMVLALSSISEFPEIQTAVQSGMVEGTTISKKGSTIKEKGDWTWILFEQGECLKRLSASVLADGSFVAI